MKLILTGIPVCGGRTAGVVRIVKDIARPLPVQRDVILVMPFFTPFVVLSLAEANGLLAEFGGTTCHAASLAREFNVPCIVGCRDVTSKLKDGDTICMDGSTGEVHEI